MRGRRSLRTVAATRMHPALLEVRVRLRDVLATLASLVVALGAADGVALGAGVRLGAGDG